MQSAADAAAATAIARRTAELLWAADFAAAVGERLRVTEGSGRGDLLQSLAWTIPSPAARAVEFQLLEKYWEEGPKRLQPAIASDDSLPEPGFLLLVKRLPRKDIHRAPANNSASDRGAAGWSSGSKRAKSAAAQQVKDRQNQAAQQWLVFSRKLAQAMCRQMWTAAAARAGVAAKSDLEKTQSELAIKLPANADIVASHHVEWPEGLDGAMAWLRQAPLRVCYVRIERKARPDKLLAYYRRQLPSGSQHADEHGVWLDEFSFDRKKGTTRSVDVFIATLSKDVDLALDQEQQMIVEILAVEVVPQTAN